MNADPSDDAASGRNATRHCVLLAEDDDSIRLLLGSRLRAAGFEVIAVASGEEAIMEGARRGVLVHVVVTDGIMSGIDGLEVARYFSRLEPPVSVILITGFIDYFVSRKDVPGNIVAMLEKPLAADEFVAAVRDCLVRSGHASGPAPHSALDNP